MIFQAIHGYRETEKPSWNETNAPAINRLKKFAFSGSSTLNQVHVLDLSEKGHIKPHLDSIKVRITAFCKLIMYFQLFMLSLLVLWRHNCWYILTVAQRDEAGKY